MTDPTKLSEAIEILDEILWSTLIPPDQHKWQTIKDGVRELMEENAKLKESYAYVLGERNRLSERVGELIEDIDRRESERRDNVHTIMELCKPDGYTDPNKADRASDANIILHLTRSLHEAAEALNEIVMNQAKG